MTPFYTEVRQYLKKYFRRKKQWENYWMQLQVSLAFGLLVEKEVLLSTKM
jgi:hypothetical protein